MTAASAALLYLDARWMFGALKWDDMATTTAWGLLALLNGPGFRVFRLLGGSFYGLAGIAIFWFSRGLLLDRRLAGLPTIRTRKPRLRAALPSLGLSISFLVATAAANQLRSEILHVWHLPQTISDHPRKTLLGRDVLAVAFLIWGVACTIYFSTKLWRAWSAILAWQVDVSEPRSRVLIFLFFG
jgi:hypothetical protein